MNLATLLSLLFLALQVVILAICIWLGYRRGTGRSVVRLIYLSVLAVLSFFLARWLAGLFSGVALSAVARFYSEPIKQLRSGRPRPAACGQDYYRPAVPVIFALVFGVLQLLSIRPKTLSEKLILLVKKTATRKVRPAADRRRNWRDSGILIAAVLLAPLSCGCYPARSTHRRLKRFGLPGYETRRQTPPAWHSKIYSPRSRRVWYIGPFLLKWYFTFAGFRRPYYRSTY